MRCTRNTSIAPLISPMVSKSIRTRGWVLILPDQYRHYIRIITEGTNMEAAEEISTNFKKQIKRLAYPDEMVYNNPE